MMPDARTQRISPTREGDQLVARFDAAVWLRELRRIDVCGKTETLRSGAHESLLVVMAGVHDLFAGSGSWTRRGTRPTPYEGRPIALYLPPHTPYGSAPGDGVLLVASVREPEFEPGRDARDNLARKPLLPLLGSGKAFDPTSGEWKPRETFPDSPEAILPRRIVRSTTSGGAAYERILGLEYKTRGLAIDEATLAADVALRFEPPSAAQFPAECAIWLEFDGEVHCDGNPLPRDGNPCVLVCTPSAMPELVLRTGRAWALAVYAGAKPSN